MCVFLLENLDLTKFPLSEQEDEIQTNLKEPAEIPVMAELLSPIDKAKNDFRNDATHEQLQSFRAYRNLIYWPGPIEPEALFY